MCLKSIQKRFDRKPHDDDDSFKLGWKVFKYDLGYYYFPYFRQQIITDKVPLNSWLTARTTVIPTQNGMGYETGFHIFTDRKAPVNFLADCIFLSVYNSKIVPVYYANEICLGKTTFENDTVVARRMFVPK